MSVIEIWPHCLFAIFMLICVRTLYLRGILMPGHQISIFSLVLMHYAFLMRRIQACFGGGGWFLPENFAAYILHGRPKEHCLRFRPSVGLSPSDTESPSQTLGLHATLAEYKQNILKDHIWYRLKYRLMSICTPSLIFDAAKH
jgi:hypothetical protein